jgi:hypothetical protein
MKMRRLSSAIGAFGARRMRGDPVGMRTSQKIIACISNCVNDIHIVMSSSPVEAGIELCVSAGEGTDRAEAPFLHVSCDEAGHERGIDCALPGQAEIGLRRAVTLHWIGGMQVSRPASSVICRVSVMRRHG